MVKQNIFLALIVGIILSILSWYYYSYIHNKDKFPFRGYDIERGDFFGTSTQGKAYNIKATYVTKIGKNLYNLNKVYIKYYMDKKNEQYIEATSSTGVFNESQNLLTLNGDVEFIVSQGYRMLTDNFFIDMNARIATTKDEILLSGTQGKIVSKNGMIVYMKKKKIVFHGPIQSMFIEGTLIKQ